MFKLFVLILLVAGWAIAAAAVHVVRTPANLLTVTLVTKNEMTFKDTYVDTREWKMPEVEKHPAVVKRLIGVGQADAIANATGEKDVKDAEEELLEAVARARKEEGKRAATTSPSALSAALAQIKAGKIKPEELAKLVAASR